MLYLNVHRIVYTGLIMHLAQLYDLRVYATGSGKCEREHQRDKNMPENASPRLYADRFFAIV